MNKKGKKLAALCGIALTGCLLFQTMTPAVAAQETPGNTIQLKVGDYTAEVQVPSIVEAYDELSLPYTLTGPKDGKAALSVNSFEDSDTDLYDSWLPGNIQAQVEYKGSLPTDNYDVDKDAQPIKSSVVPSGSRKYYVTITNTGDTVWKAQGLGMVYSALAIFSVGRDAEGNVTSMNSVTEVENICLLDHDVYPGESVDVSYMQDSWVSSGEYLLSFRLYSHNETVTNFFGPAQCFSKLDVPIFVDGYTRGNQLGEIIATYDPSQSDEENTILPTLTNTGTKTWKIVEQDGKPYLTVGDDSDESTFVYFNFKDGVVDRTQPDRYFIRVTYLNNQGGLLYTDIAVNGGYKSGAITNVSGDGTLGSNLFYFPDVVFDLPAPLMGSDFRFGRNDAQMFIAKVEVGKYTSTMTEQPVYVSPTQNTLEVKDGASGMNVTYGMANGTPYVEGNGGVCFGVSDEVLANHEELTKNAHDYYVTYTYYDDKELSGAYLYTNFSAPGAGGAHNSVADFSLNPIGDTKTFKSFTYVIKGAILDNNLFEWGPSQGVQFMGQVLNAKLRLSKVQIGLYEKDGDQNDPAKVVASYTAAPEQTLALKTERYTVEPFGDTMITRATYDNVNDNSTLAYAYKESTVDRSKPYTYTVDVYYLDDASVVGDTITAKFGGENGWVPAENTIQVGDSKTIQKGTFRVSNLKMTQQNGIDLVLTSGKSLAVEKLESLWFEEGTMEQIPIQTFPTYYEDYSEFMRGYSVKETTGEAVTGEIKLSVQPWAGEFNVKLVTEDGMQNVRVPFNPKLSNLVIDDKSPDGFTVETERGTENYLSTWYYPYRVGRTDDDYETRIDKDLTDMKNSGVNVVWIQMFPQIMAFDMTGPTQYALEKCKDLGLKVIPAIYFTNQAGMLTQLTGIPLKTQTMNGFTIIDHSDTNFGPAMAEWFRLLYNGGTAENGTEIGSYGDVFYKTADGKIPVVMSEEAGMGIWEYRTGGFDADNITAFREWLKEKYGTLDAVNQAWGTSYASFEAINPQLNYPLNPVDYPDEWKEGSAALGDFDSYRSSVVANAYKNIGDSMKSIMKETEDLDLLVGLMTFPAYGLEGIRDENNFNYYSYRDYNWLAERTAVKEEYMLNKELSGLDFVTCSNYPGKSDWSLVANRIKEDSNNQIIPLLYPEFNAMQTHDHQSDGVINPAWGDYYLSLEGIEAQDHRSLYALYPTLKSLVENGSTAGFYCWNDHPLYARATETQMKELKLFSDVVNGRVDPAKTQTDEATGVQITGYYAKNDTAKVTEAKDADSLKPYVTALSAQKQEPVRLIGLENQVSAEGYAYTVSIPAEAGQSVYLVTENGLEAIGTPEAGSVTFDTVQPGVYLIAKQTGASSGTESSGQESSDGGNTSSDGNGNSSESGGNTNTGDLLPIGICCIAACSVGCVILAKRMKKLD